MLSRKQIATGAALAGTILTSTMAMAQDTAPSMDAIELPVDLTSVIASVTAIGAVIFIAVWGIRLSFRMGNKGTAGAANAIKI